MIDYEKSAKLNNMTVDELKIWFNKHPGSGRRIVGICDDCDEEREIYFYAYRDLCKSCSTKKAHKDNPDAWNTDAVKLGYKKVGIALTEYFSDQRRRDEMSDKKKQFYIDNPEEIVNMSKRTIQYHIDNPEAREAARLKTIEQMSDPEARNRLSEIKLNSDATKVEAKRQLGGLDLIWHHVAYDFGRLEALRVRITRKFHGHIHNPKGIQISQYGYSLID